MNCSSTVALRINNDDSEFLMSEWSHSVVYNSETSWTGVFQAPPSIRFSKQEYWSGLSFTSPGDLPDPGIEPRSSALQADTLPSEPPGKPWWGPWWGWKSEKVGLKFNIQKSKIMASSPITSQQIDGGKVETVTDFIFLGSRITVDGDCSHESKGCFLFGRKAMTNPDSILKSTDITLPTRVHIVKAVIFSSSHVWMWRLDHKQGWPQRNWCFWTVVL